MPPIENTLTATPDLYDHLLWQLHMSVSDELLLEIGDAIIQNLDEDGMLRASVEEIANMGPYRHGGGGEGALRWCRAWTPPAWPRATSRSACASSSGSSASRARPPT